MHMNTKAIDRVLAALGDTVRQQSINRWAADCPACQYGDALSITSDGRGVGLRCHGQDPCETGEVVEALGLAMGDLFNAGPPKRTKRGEANSDGAERERDVRVLRLSFVDITGSHDAALILNQLIYWSTKRGGVNRDGRHWIAKANADWYAELRIKPRTAQRAIAKLRTSGLVETREWLFAGRKVNHLRVVDEALDAALAQLEGRP